MPAPAPLDQMVLAEYCDGALRRPCGGAAQGAEAQARRADGSSQREFGTAAEFDVPDGGIFLWIKLPDTVDTLKLFQAASKEGVGSTRARNGGRCRARALAPAPVLRQSDRADDPRRRRQARGDLQPRVRRADPHRERRALNRAGASATGSARPTVPSTAWMAASAWIAGTTTKINCKLTMEQLENMCRMLDF